MRKTDIRNPFYEDICKNGIVVDVQREDDSDLPSSNPYYERIAAAGGLHAPGRPRRGEVRGQTTVRSIRLPVEAVEARGGPGEARADLAQRGDAPGCPNLADVVAGLLARHRHARSRPARPARPGGPAAPSQDPGLHRRALLDAPQFGSARGVRARVPRHRAGARAGTKFDIDSGLPGTWPPARASSAAACSCGATPLPSCPIRRLGCPAASRTSSL